MSWFNDDAQALEAARAAGFTSQPPHTAKVLEPFLPYEECRGLADCTFASWNEIGPYIAWLLDYDYSEERTAAVTRSGPTADYHGTGIHTEHERYTAHVSGTLAILQHPEVRETVDVLTDWRASTAGAIVNALLWIPPFTFVKPFQYAALAKNPDREIGHEEFDRRFLVRAASAEAAQAAIHPALGELLVASDFKGRLSMRPGAVILQFGPPKPGAQGFAERFELMRGVLGAVDRVR
jgi:hypothetical protein